MVDAGPLTAAERSTWFVLGVALKDSAASEQELKAGRLAWSPE